MKVDMEGFVQATLGTAFFAGMATALAYIITLAIREITLNECWPMCSAAQCGDHRSYASSKFEASCVEEKK